MYKTNGTRLGIFKVSFSNISFPESMYLKMIVKNPKVRQYVLEAYLNKFENLTHFVSILSAKCEIAAVVTGAEWASFHYQTVKLSNCSLARLTTSCPQY